MTKPVSTLRPTLLFFVTFRLGRRALGEARVDRTAWVYALLLAPVATWWLSFDTVSTFFLLLIVERWLAGRRAESALAMGIGALVKWPPLRFLPVAVGFGRDWREAAR